MKSASPRRTKAPNGITLVELTVVISVLLTLAVVLMVGAKAWRRGVDRTKCVITIRNVQQSVRSYQNLSGYYSGSKPVTEAGTRSIIDHLLIRGYIDASTHKSIKIEHTCPGGGEYVIPDEEVFPPGGQLYLGCSLATSEDHEIKGKAVW